MAVSHTGTQSLDLLSHPSGYELKGVDEVDEHQQQLQFQDTVPLEDAFVPDSLSMEETQLVDFSDFSEKTRTGVHEYEEEVVLDSEDDEVNGSRIVSVKSNVLLDQKLGPHREQFAAGLVSPINFGTTEGEKDEGSPPIARLNYIDSQEPGESAQANALGFVDLFVSLNDVLGGSPKIDDHKKPVREKSPPVSNTKGFQRLARMKSQVEIHKAFEWVDLPEERWGVDLINKEINSSSDFRECKQRSVVQNQKVRHGGGDKKCISLGGKSKEKKITQGLHKEITESEGMIGNESDNKSEQHLNAKSTGLEEEASDVRTDMVDMFDVGFNTQIAAEAMEALAYGDLPDCNFADAYQGMEKTADVSRGAPENKALLELPLRKSDVPDIGGINKNAKQRKRSTRTVRRVAASYQRQSSSWELDPHLAAQTKGKRSRFFSEHCSNFAAANGNFCRQSPKHTKHQKVERATGGRSVGTGDEPKNPGERVNDVTGDCIIKYRRRKRRLNAHPSEIISGSEGGFNKRVESMNKVTKGDIITYKRKKSISPKENSSKSCVSSERDKNRTTSTLNLESWSHPKGKRTRLNARRNSCLATFLCTSFPIVDGKDSTSRFDERPESNNNIKGKIHSLDKDSDRSLLALQSRKLDARDPTSLVDVKSHTSVVSSGSEYTAQSNSTTGINVGSSKHVSDGHHRRTYNKNLPKSSLLKELIGLGVPESTPDYAWKDLRRRRNMAYVRVLFSQHLDDAIIKQQKKVIARLGLSVASCSTDATHFVADQFARTRNMLEFIALGKPVVTHLWLESCGQANCLISEKIYILRDAKKEKEIGFSMLVSLDCAKRCPLLKGRKVFITPNIKPDKEMMISLVKAVQGQPVEKVQMSAAKDKKNFKDVLILSCEEDRAVCLPFLEQGAAVYSSELLLNGIVIQRLEYKRHRLFTTEVRGVVHRP
ncbi:hypothetical protein FF1_008105 [Malus domestica]